MLTVDSIVQLLKTDQTTSITEMEELAALILGGGQFKKLGEISYTSFQPSATFTKTIDVGSGLIPPRGFIQALYLDYQTPYAAPGLLSAALTIADEAGNNYLTNIDIFRATGNEIGASFSGGGGGVPFSTVVPNKAAASDIRATLTLNAAAVINTLTAGKVTLYGIITAVPNS